MSSDYTGSGTTVHTTVELMTGGDRPTAQRFRVPLERVIDSLAALKLLPVHESEEVIREEFWGGIWDPATSRLDASFPWRTTDDGSPSVSHVAGNSKNPGQLVCQIPGDGVNTNLFEFHVGGATELPFSFTNNIKRATFVVRINEDAGNIADQTRFGFCDDASAPNGGNDSLIIVRARAISATKWVFIRRNGGSQTTTALTLADYTDNVFAVWDMIWTVNGDVEVSLNKTLVHTVFAANVPVGSCNVSALSLTTPADNNVLDVRWDFISVHARANNGGPRNGA